MADHQQSAKVELAVGAEHDIRFDRAGFNGSIPRYTCMNSECCCATLVRSKYPNPIDWKKAKEDFFAKHPSASRRTNIKDEGFQI